VSLTAAHVALRRLDTPETIKTAIQTHPILAGLLQQDENKRALASHLRGRASAAVTPGRRALRSSDTCISGGAFNEH
jgi:hypothetical protein